MKRCDRRPSFLDRYLRFAFATLAIDNPYLAESSPLIEKMPKHFFQKTVANSLQSVQIQSL